VSERRASALIALALLACGCGGSDDAEESKAPSDECITDASAKPDHVFQCSDLAWNVSVPETCTKGGCGLIFDVHGFSMSGTMEDRNTNLAALGRDRGYIVVNPNADPAPPLAGWVALDDDPKVMDFIARVTKVFRTDPKRFHFTGFSQGGDMTWRFICDHSDLVASAAPAAMSHSENEHCFSEAKAPPREMPMLFMHGTADKLVPFTAAEAARDAVVATLAMTKDSTLSSDASHEWTRYTNANGTVFEFIQHDYTGADFLGGHCYPGSTDPGGQTGQVFDFDCYQPAAFVWGEAVMAFFEAHPMP